MSHHGVMVLHSNKAGPGVDPSKELFGYLDKTLCLSITLWIMRGASDMAEVVLLCKFLEFTKSILGSVVTHHCFWDAVPGEYGFQRSNYTVRGCLPHLHHFRVP